MEKKYVTNRDCMDLLRRRMCSLFWKIAEEKEKITIDGVPGYNEKAQFVGGKVINLCSYVALTFSENDDEKKKMLDAMHELIVMCSKMEMETWGILNGLTGLYRLKTAGVYDRVVDTSVDERLKQIMDWHTFVDAEQDYALIHKPTNYYGVAFGIARYRELLGWDALGSSEILLNHLMNHISKYSGEYGFMDETRGEGRFDRYSILIPAEITELVLKTGWEEPNLIRSMLGRSARIVLQMANKGGWGFSYGRSIGAYGETAVLQILAAAAELGDVLNEREEQLAWLYSLKCLRTMILFWYDEEMQSINMWDKGRRTDGYRNKNRILGENLSLSMQIIDVIEQWKKLGYDFQNTADEESVIDDKEDGLTFTRFAHSVYDRGLVIYRNDGHVWSLPLINGGTPYFDKDAYLPVPRENRVLEAVPDVHHAALVPKLVLEDRTELMPICYFDSIEITDGNDSSEAGRCKIRMKGLCRIGGNSPETVEGIETETIYIFRNHEIIRQDNFVIHDKGIKVKEITLAFDTFSDNGAEEMGTVIFGEGPIREIEAAGYEWCRVKNVDSLPGESELQAEQAIDLSQAGMKEYKMVEDSFDTPHGANKTQVCWKKTWDGKSEIKVGWKLQYR